jgi:type IV secretion system protein VirB4
MFLQPEARREAKGLSDLIDYFGLAADGVVLTTTGVYLAAWEFAGPDMDSLPVAECFATADRLARHFALGLGWHLQSDLIRGEYAEYIGVKAAWPGPLTAIIEEERETTFSFRASTGPRCSVGAFCDLRMSSERGMRAASRKLVGLAEERDDALARFEKKVREIENAFKGMLRTVRRLKGYKRVVGQAEVHCDELLEYIRLCVEGEHYPFAALDVPIDLNQYLATKDFTGGADLQLGDPDDDIQPGEHIRVLSIDSFPSHSFAGILREMDAVPLAFRLTHQAQRASLNIRIERLRFRLTINGASGFSPDRGSERGEAGAGGARAAVINRRDGAGRAAFVKVVRRRCKAGLVEIFR